VSRHYLDHASTSPVRPEAMEAMARCLRDVRGDPARIHHEGQVARVTIEEAREKVAALLGARSREVVFTSGATEAIATAIHGAVARAAGGDDTLSGDAHVVAAAVEHSAVRLGSGRHDLSLVGCDRQGRVDADELMAAVRADTALVHLQWGNHEVGTTQPVEEVVARCRDRGVLVHVDAAQAAGHVPVDFGSLGADLMSVSAHKMGGPSGVGALLVRRGLRLDPLLIGGDQERARRAGLENLPAIAGWGAAAEALAGTLAEEARADRKRTERVLEAAALLEGVEVFGDPEGRLPHLVCLGIRDVEPQAVLLGLDQAGIAVHSGSACASEDLVPSPVLEAMGVDAHHSLRVSVGWSTTDDDIDALLGAVPAVLDRLRALGAGPVAGTADARER
jgi:cysteine desulfurase